VVEENNLKQNISTSQGTTVILNVDLKGNPRVLFESDRNVQVLWAIPSPDGRHAALDVITGENNVWMVENFCMTR
jgi:hypothetical protein